MLNRSFVLAASLSLLVGCGVETLEDDSIGVHQSAITREVDPVTGKVFFKKSITKEEAIQLRRNAGFPADDSIVGGAFVFTSETEDSEVVSKKDIGVNRWCWEWYLDKVTSFWWANLGDQIGRVSTRTQDDSGTIKLTISASTTREASFSVNAGLPNSALSGGVGFSRGYTYSMEGERDLFVPPYHEGWIEGFSSYMGYNFEMWEGNCLSGDRFWGNGIANKPIGSYFEGHLRRL